MEQQTPDQTIERLKQGNQRFREDHIAGNGRDSLRRVELTSGQSPLAIILSCSDSRVVPEIAFDTGLGELFVVRVAGNVANRSSIASIEYAVHHLGVKLVVVMGHESCGAVGAALAGGDNGKNLNHLLEHIQPALVADGGQDIGTVAQRNARLNADRLVEESDIIRRAVESEGVKIIVAYYHLKTGEVEFL